MRDYLRNALLGNAFFLAIIVMVVFVVFSPLMFGYVFYDEEQFGFYYPQSFFQSEILEGKKLPYWNTMYYGGVPVSLEQFVSSYYPLHWILFGIFSFVAAHHLSIILATTAGCLFAYWFGRSFGFSNVSSFVLSMSYLLATGFLWLDVGTLVAHSFLVLPAVLVAVLKIDQQKRPVLFLLLGGAALGVGFLAGFPQIIFYMYSIALAFALYLDWRKDESLRTIARYRATLGLMGITILAALIGARQLLPSALLIDLTVRTSTYASQFGHSVSPSVFLNYLFPEYVRIPFIGGGASGFYVGALGFLSLLFGLAYARSRDTYFFLLLYGIIAGFAFHVPIFSWLNEHVSPFSHMGEQFRWILAAAFPLSFLAAHGYEKLISAEIKPERYRRFLLIGAIALCVLVAGSIAGTAGLHLLEKNPEFQKKFLDWYFAGKSKQLSQEHYLNVLRVTIEEAKTNLSLLQWRFSSVLLLLAAAFAALWLFLRQKISRETFSYLTVAIVVLNVFVAFMGQYRENLVSVELLREEPALVKELKRRESDLNAFRTSGFLVSDSLFTEVTSKTKLSETDLTALQKELMVNSSNMLYGIQKLDGFAPYRTLRANQLINTVVLPRGLEVFDDSSPALKTSGLRLLFNTDVSKVVSMEEKIKDLYKRLPLFSMMNVKYIYTLLPLSHPQLKEVASIPLAPHPIAVHVYENKSVLPRAYFARDVNFFSGRDIDLLEKVAKTADFAKETFIECAVCPPPLAGRNAAKIAEYQNGRIIISAGTERGGWLVFSEASFPGWDASIDGMAAPLYTANYLFQAVYVPAGKHTVEFVYTDITLSKWQKIKEIFRN